MEHLLFGWMQKVDWLDRADWLTMGLRLMLAISVIEAMPDQELFAVLHPGPPKMEKGSNVLVQLWTKKWKFLKGFACRHLNRSSPVLAMMCAIIGSQLPSMQQYENDMYRQKSIAAWAYCQQCSSSCPVQSAITIDAIQIMLPELKKEADLLVRQRERWLVGWVCYLMAITQYLIIGLVTSRDRALDVLSEFDRAVAKRRNELIEEFKLEGNLPVDFDPHTQLNKLESSAKATSNEPPT
jgi:ferredoxin